MNETIFHISDLAVIWGISNKNNLHTTLKRYAKQKLLYRVYRGLYSILPIDKVDSFLLGAKAIHGYSYVSTETVLARAGIISQKLNYITFVSSKSRRFSVGNRDYYVRQMNDRFLFNDIGIEKKSGVNFAGIDRAIADMIYYNPRAHFDSPGKINWKKINQIQKYIGYPIIKR